MAIINSMHIIPNKEHQFVELISNNNYYATNCPYLITYLLSTKAKYFTDFPNPMFGCSEKDMKTKRIITLKLSHFLLIILGLRKKEKSTLPAYTFAAKFMRALSFS